MSFSLMIDRFLELLEEPETESFARRETLTRFLEASGPARIYWLLSIMYIGRGDFEFATTSPEDIYQYMTRQFSEPSHAIDQMLSKAAVATYLRKGLDRLAAEGVAVDDLPGV